LQVTERVIEKYMKFAFKFFKIFYVGEGLIMTPNKTNIMNINN